MGSYHLWRGETDRLHSAHERRVAPFLRFLEGSAKRLGSMADGRRGGQSVQDEDGLMEEEERTMARWGFRGKFNGISANAQNIHICDRDNFLSWLIRRYIRTFDCLDLL